MRATFERVTQWIESGRACALATLVELREAKTAPLGTTIAVASDGAIAGNIGAGCYESEIVETALQTARDGILRHLDIDLDLDDEVLGGTGCGAVMRVIVWRPDRDVLPTLRAIAAGERPVVLTIDGWACTFEAKAPLLIVGATALAQDLCAVACRADFRTIVIDPRIALATPERVPSADAIVHAWPQEYLPRVLGAESCVVVLSHDPKLDLPSLECALASSAAYVGLLGSRRAQAARRRALLERGCDPAALERIHGPVGLDIGGVTTAETAVSIVAELIAVRRRRSAVPLRALAGSIH